MSVGGYHFVTGSFTSHRSFLPDKEYGVALDNFVKGCSDMLIQNSKGQILTGKRNVHPQPDWWFVGGRMMPGESPGVSCSRLLKRELSLNIAADRFKPLCFNSMVWGMREQEPKANGTCDVNIVLTVQLSEEEASQIVLDPKEYTDSKWVAPEEMLEGSYHPALQCSVRSLLSAAKLSALQNAVGSGAEDRVVAALAKDLVGIAQTEPTLGESSYRVKNEELGYDGSVSVSKW